MTELGKAPVEQSDAPVVTPEVVVKSGDTVPLETHRRLLDEKKRAQAKLDEFIAKEKEREEADAVRRGDDASRLKARDEELAKERTKRIELETRFEHGQKMNAIIDALGGNVDPRWYKLIDVSGVTLDPDTGEVDGLLVAKVAESLKREFPEIVRSKAGLPAEAPKGNGTGTISYDQWKVLPLVEMKKWKQSQIVY